MGSKIIAISIVTLVLFQSTIIAPVANLILEKEQTALFLRLLWPIFFVLIIILSAICLILFRRQKVVFKKNILSTGAMAVCIAVVPCINNAMDSGNLSLWKVLHLCTVALTIFTLVLQVQIIRHNT